MIPANMDAADALISTFSACAGSSAVCLATLEFRLGALDAAVIVVPVLPALGVSLYMRRLTRGAADDLAANRSAGRCLISTAQMEMGMTAKCTRAPQPLTGVALPVQRPPTAAIPKPRDEPR